MSDRKGFIEQLQSGEKSFISRRDMFKIGAGLLAGTMLPDALGGLGHASAQSLKHIYIAADDHIDYVWRWDEATVNNAILTMLDYYLNQIDQTIGNQTEHQMRWNCDGHLWMWLYERNRNATQFNRLINRIKDGHVSVPLNAICVCLGGTPAEAVLRGMYYAGQMERRHNLDLTLAYIVENQTLPYGLGALWAGAGAKYSWRGICGCSSRIPSNAQLPRPSEIYWWVGPDGSRILMKWYSFQDIPGIGSYAELRDPHNPSSTGDVTPAINLLTDKIGTASYPYNVSGGFGLGWDGLQTLATAFVSSAQAATDSTRLVHVSNEKDFFDHFVSLYGSDPSVLSQSVTYGNEWELFQASLVEVTASVKRATEKLRGAEALAALVSLKNAAFMNGRETQRDQAWMNLGLYWEHNWMADGGQVITKDDREQWSRNLAGQINGYVNTLHNDAVAALGGMITKTGTNTRFFAFNPLSWTCTDAVDFPYPSGSTAIHVVDVTTDSEVPSQVITIEGVRYLRVLAENVPAVGYKVFEIRSGTGTNFGDAATVTGGNTLDNSVYQLVVSNFGAITSLIDHTRSNRQFVRVIGSRTINDFGSTDGTTSLNVMNAGPVSVTLTATNTGSSTVPDYTASITLFRNSSRIDIRNRITENFSSVPMWGFSFNLDSPDVWHEEVGAIIRAKKADAGGHYATSHARYDWLTMNHFADMSGTGNVGVTLSNIDCQYMKLANSTPSNFVTTIAQIYVLAGGQVDGATFGIVGQGGDTSFLQRFALQTHSAYDPAAAMRFSLEHQNPLIAGTVTGGSQYPEKTFTLLSTSNQNILLWAIKPAEDGISEGLITRWWNMASGSQNLAFTLPGAPITSAQKASHVETPQGAATVNSGTLQQSFTAQQMSTFLLKVSSPPPGGSTPANGAPTQNYFRTGTPTLTWGRLSWAVGYEVQLSRTSTFTSPINSGVLAGDQTSYPVSPALDEGTWYWRVHGLKSLSPVSAGTWSAPQSFVIDLP